MVWGTYCDFHQPIRLRLVWRWSSAMAIWDCCLKPHSFQWWRVRMTQPGTECYMRCWSMGSLFVAGGEALAHRMQVGLMFGRQRKPIEEAAAQLTRK